MSNSDRPYFLPITSHSAKAFFGQGDLPNLPVERAALLAIQMLLRGELRVSGLDRLLAEATETFRMHEPAGALKLESFRQEVVDGAKVEIRQRLFDHHVHFASQAQMASEVWATPKRTYSFDFQDSCRQTLSDYDVPVAAADGNGEDSEDDEEYSTEPIAGRRVIRLHGTRDQAVAAAIIASSGDDHVALDAYAGTGKTHLIHTLNASLGSRFTYLAPDAARKYGFEQHATAQGMVATTLWSLATGMADRHARRGQSWSIPRAGKTSLYTEEEQVAHAGIYGIGGQHPVVVLRSLKRAIDSWSRGESADIQPSHFARTSAKTDCLSAYISAANGLWKAMFAMYPKKGPVFDVTLHHLVKWLAINDVEIPSSNGTLLVDESHDLIGPWHQLFDRYDGACVRMGDPHQRVRGYARRHERAKPVTMARSVRLGLEGERLIERTLSMAPARLIQVPFSGSSEHMTRLRTYRGSAPLPECGLRIYGNEWSLLDDAIRLREQGASFRFLPATGARLSRTVVDAMALQASNEPSTIAVTGHYTWGTLAALLTKQGKSNVMRMLRQDFKGSGWGKFLAAQAGDGEQRITLGLLEHTKNYENDIVSLSECCFENPTTGGLERYNPINGAYLAMTRAKHELWVPGDAVDRLSDAQRE
ncbi:hypothetical protein [Lysobacter sp. CA196]|uniref:hypothetical protein n=1 Tax=Lysobacter sp. CA196 TaxID=3455606 RepID=UPI003F8D1344